MNIVKDLNEIGYQDFAFKKCIFYSVWKLAFLKELLRLFVYFVIDID